MNYFEILIIITKYNDYIYIYVYIYMYIYIYIYTNKTNVSKYAE